MKLLRKSDNIACLKGISFKFIDCCNSEEKITKNLSDILFSPSKQDV